MCTNKGMKMNKHNIDCFECIKLYQHDKGQILLFPSELQVNEVQFSNGSVKIVEGNEVKVPDSFLEKSGEKFAWAQCVSSDSETTVKEIRIRVLPRTIKNDYIEPENEQTFREYIEQSIEEMKQMMKEVLENK